MKQILSEKEPDLQFECAVWDEALTYLHEHPV